jgi:hypothetical protein
MLTNPDQYPARYTVHTRLHLVCCGFCTSALASIHARNNNTTQSKALAMEALSDRIEDGCVQARKGSSSPHIPCHTRHTNSRIYTRCKSNSCTYDHRIMKTRLPVRSALFKHDTGGLVVKWVTISESLLLYVFDLFGAFLV